MMAGFVPLYQRRVAVAVKRPIALVGQLLTPVLWVLIVAPAFAATFGATRNGVDVFTYIAIGQIVFVLPFSAMFAGLVVLTDRDMGILRELLVAPIRRATITVSNIAAILTVAAGQLVLIVALALARGADFHAAPSRVLIALLGAALLSGGVYALAEILAYRITQPAIFGTLIPAIGATPYALCGAIYPLAALPDSVRAVSDVLPWTHAVALLRFGFMGAGASGLGQIWHLHSVWAMALLSLAALGAFAAAMVVLALRTLRAATTR